MKRNARIHKSILISDMGDQREMNHSSQKQQSNATNLSVQSRRTHAVIREPVTSIERAMDIAIGAEPWNEKEAA
jgi:hypothetical protein